MKKYFVVVTFEGEEFEKVMTEDELCENYEEEMIAGIGFDFDAFRYENGTMVKVNVYDMWREWRKAKDWQEQEYRDYCDTVNEYGYDYQ